MTSLCKRSSVNDRPAATLEDAAVADFPGQRPQQRQFVSANTFQGAKVGYVFSTGSADLCYYRDDEWRCPSGNPSHGVRPIVSELMICSITSSTGLTTLLATTALAS